MFPILYFNLEIIMKNKTVTNFEKHETIIIAEVKKTITDRKIGDKVIISHMGKLNNVSVDDVWDRLYGFVIDRVKYIINLNIDPKKNKHEVQNKYYKKVDNEFICLDADSNIVDRDTFVTTIKEHCNFLINHQLRSTNQLRSYSTETK